MRSCAVGAAGSRGVSSCYGHGRTTAITGPGSTRGSVDVGNNYPQDGAPARVRFHWLKGLAFAPDGTLYMRDEHLVRKLDASGQVSTWAF